MNEATARSLGDKLANLDLTDEEGELLLALLSTDDDVEGFGFMDSSWAKKVNANLEEVKVTYAPIVAAPVASNFSFGVE